jgi:hypothetical protein
LKGNWPVGHSKRGEFSKKRLFQRGKRRLGSGGGRKSEGKGREGLRVMFGKRREI